MINKHISEAHRRVIEWTVGGRIIHRDMEGKVVGMEDYTKATLNKIMKFLLEKPDGKMIRKANFNAAAKPMFEDLKGLDVEYIDGTFHAKPNSTAKATNKIHYSGGVGGQENLSMYIRASDQFKANTRYAIDIASDGSMEFVEFETIRSENLNTRYDEPLLNIYETAA